MRFTVSAYAQRHLVRDFQSIALERNHFLWVVSQDANLLQTEIDQNLSPNSALALNQSLPAQIAVNFTARMHENRRQLTLFGSRIDPESASRMMQINKYSAILASNLLERSLDEFMAVASRRSEHISRQTVRMYAHKRRRFAAKFAANERNVHFAIHIA